MAINGWKITAIIFMIAFVAETLLIAWAWNLGGDAIEKENDCQINVCESYEAFLFDSYNQMCYCYEDGEVVYEKYIT